MNRLSSRLARVAVVSVLAAVATSFSVLWVTDYWQTAMLERDLSPDLLAEWRGDGPVSAELLVVLERHYASPAARLMTPVAALLGLLVGGLVGAAHAGRFLTRLGGLAQAARAIRRGDLSARAPTGASDIDEIERFIRDFNTMAATIERGDRDRRETSAAIAHELRTPLTVLTGRLNGMLDGVFPMDRAAIAALLAQTGLLARIVDDLRLLTLADSGRLQLDVAPIDLAQQVGLALEGCRPLILAGGTQISTALAPAPALADAERVRQAVLALVENAGRYGGEGGDLRVETGTDEGAAWLRVMDRGPGLDTDQAARAFDRFWRADVSRGRDSGGSGLGLSVVQAIARAHGGAALYRDRPGGGALFEIRFPCARGDEMADLHEIST